MSKNLFWMIGIVIVAIVGVLLGPTLLRGVSMKTAGIAFVVFLLGYAAIVVYSLSANRGGGAAASDVEAEARRMQPGPGKARIYIVRTGFAAALQSICVGIDNVATGLVKSDQFVTAEVEPGDYRVTARLTRGGKSKGSIDVTVAQDEVVVVHACLELGAFSNSIILARLEPNEARGRLAGAGMVLWAED